MGVRRGDSPREACGDSPREACGDSPLSVNPYKTNLKSFCVFHEKFLSSP